MWASAVAADEGVAQMAIGINAMANRGRGSPFLFIGYFVSLFNLDILSEKMKIRILWWPCLLFFFFQFVILI
jgi:hypothetical protein